MKIFVNTLTGRTITLDVKPSDSIDDVKQNIQNKVNIPCSQQKLIYDEMVLEDEGTLYDYNITKRTTIHMAEVEDQLQLDYDLNLGNNGKKCLSEFNLDPYIQEVKIMNSIDDFDNNDNDDDDYACVFKTYALCSDSDDESEEPKTEEDIAREKTLQILETEKTNNQIKKGETIINEGIQEFVLKYPHYEEIFGNIKKEYILNVTNVNDRCYAGFSEKIGDYFNKKECKIEPAAKFYNLSLKGHHYYPYYNCQSSLGYMFLNQFNQEIISKKPIQPTASLFYHLKQSIRSLSLASGMDDVAEKALPHLCQERNKIIKWHLSTKDIKDDLFYSGKLISSIYEISFMKKIYQYYHLFNYVKIKSNRYDGSLASDDITKYLIDHQFYGIKLDNYETNPYNYHHCWVNIDLFMIRIKCEWNYNTNKYLTQFSIGINRISPILWNINDQPLNLRLDKENEYVVLDKNNEILKIALKDKAFFLVPARTKYYWYDRSNSTPRNMMALSHFTLHGGFGTKTGYKGQYINTKAVEKLLTFNPS